MKKSSIIVLILCATLMVVAQRKTPVRTPTQRPVEMKSEYPSGSFTGSLFNDLFYIVQEPQAGNISATTSGRNASVLRRATIGYAYHYTRSVSAAVVYDASANQLQTASAGVKDLLPMTDVEIGLAQSLSSVSVQKIWEYRSLAPSIIEKKALTNEFEMGASVTGRTNVQGTSYASLALYNGTGLAAENDKLKKYALSLGTWFTRASVLELYTDYENVGGGRSTITAKVLYGIRTMDLMVGGEAFYRINRKFSGASDVVPAGISVFGWVAMNKSLRAVLRVDAVDENLNVSATGYRELYANIGLDYAPAPMVRLIPNVVYVKNLKKGSGTEIADNIIAQLTTAVSIH